MDKVFLARQKYTAVAVQMKSLSVLHPVYAPCRHLGLLTQGFWDSFYFPELEVEKVFQIQILHQNLLNNGSIDGFLFSYNIYALFWSRNLWE